jgi:hypothetical protein
MGTWFGVGPHAPRIRPIVATTKINRKDPIKHSLSFQRLLLKDGVGPTWVPKPPRKRSIFIEVYLHSCIDVLKKNIGQRIKIEKFEL